MALAQIIERLRSQGTDDATYEAKSCTVGLSKDVWETVSAFANTRGGTLLLGVNEADGFTPVPDFPIDRVCDQFVSGIGDGGSRSVLENPPEYQIEREILDGRPVLVIYVDELPAAQKPCFIRARGIQGGGYKRVDDKDIRLSPNELYAIQSVTAVDASDRAPVDGASVDDLDEAVCEVLFSRALMLSPRSMRGADSIDERLKRLNLTNSQGDVVRAGLLVAGKYPQQFFPKLAVDIAAHIGTSKGGSGSLRFRDRVVCEGTIGEMIEDAVHAVAKNLKRRSTVSSLGRSDELEIPELVLREAVTNALVHRSYNPRFDGEAVSVDIFDDRVELTNPGGLWGKSWGDLADGRSCCRNATLMKLLSLVPLPSGAGAPAEGNGTGILLMMAEMEKRGLRPPEFYPAIDHFKVILWRPSERASAGSRVDFASDVSGIEQSLGEHSELSINELAKQNGLSLSQARRRVRELIAQGRIEATAAPTSRNRKYRLCR